ncbi:hypothetical protein SAMN05216564_10288 [Halopenitus persicus]|uniref:Uncharacterized protein n=1 Tax=Halopenitus persicus TaxID=1048396 RepID=A0A1H3FK77_9EURY|nr:hypothetical protein SAMN05216564_10288 [Halopenitus persicus]
MSVNWKTFTIRHVPKCLPQESAGSGWWIRTQAGRFPNCLGDGFGPMCLDFAGSSPHRATEGVVHSVSASARTIVTGTGACRVTLSATLPMTTRLSPL